MSELLPAWRSLPAYHDASPRQVRRALCSRAVMVPLDVYDQVRELLAASAALTADQRGSKPDTPATTAAKGRAARTVGELFERAMAGEGRAS